MAQDMNSELRDQPVGELMKQLAEQTQTLVRKELELARAELAVKGRKAGVGAGMLSGATIAALLALGALTAFLILSLDGVMPNWAAALVVTAAWGCVAAVLALTGRERLKEAAPPIPEQTIETVEEDVQWAKTQLKSAKR
jgi:uncharacterized membrane protein YqjE